MNSAKQARTPQRIAFVAHEFGRYPGHGGIATYLLNQVESILRISDAEIHIFCISKDLHYQHPRVVIHPLKGLDFLSQQAVTSNLLALQPMWVEVADFGALCHDLLVRRALGEISINFPIIVNHHTGCREIWEWGTGIHLDGCTDSFLRGCHVLERTQAKLADANVSVSTFLTNYLQKHDDQPFLPPLFPYFPITASLPSIETDVDGRTDLRLLSLGRFEQRKKQEYLIDAVVRLLQEGEDINTTFVGNSVPVLGQGDDYRQVCFDRIPEDLRHRFTFIDFASPESVRHLYQSCDLFCIPSPMENFPTTALEAISMGLPVMGSRWSGVRDMVGDIDQLLFDPSKPGDLTHCLRQWARTPRAKLQQQASQQRTQLERLLSENNTTVRRLQVFGSISAQAKPSRQAEAPALRVVVLDSDAGKATLKMARSLTGKKSNFALALGHDTQFVQTDEAVDFVYCPDGTPEAVLQTLMQLVSASCHLRDIPLTLSARYDKVADIRAALSTGRMAAFAARIYAGSGYSSAFSSWNERLALYLVNSRALACLHHPEARDGRLSVPLRTCAMRVLHPYETAHAHHVTDSRPDLRLLASGL